MSNSIPTSSAEGSEQPLTPVTWQEGITNLFDPQREIKKTGMIQEGDSLVRSLNLHPETFCHPAFAIQHVKKLEGKKREEILEVLSYTLRENGMELQPNEPSVIPTAPKQTSRRNAGGAWPVWH